MNFGRALDNMIAAIAPMAGLRRINARAAFEAASHGPRNDSFYRHNPDGRTVSKEQSVINATARDFERNNPWATQAVRILSTNTVGWGIEPIISDAALKAKFRKWARSVVTVGDPELNFSGVQMLTARSVFTGGECFVVRRVTRRGLRLSVHTSEEIDTSRDIEALRHNQPQTVNGIEYARDGSRVGYWFKQDLIDSKRFDASDVAHIYFPKWTRQNRGISDFASALVRLQAFDQLEDAQIKQQVVAACLGVFIKDLDGVGETTETPTKLTPGMVGHLSPGQDVAVVNPPTSQGQSEGARMALRAIAAAFGVTYEDLTGDYSSANFSTMRAARLTHWQWVRVLQWIMFEPLLLDKVWGWWANVENIPDETPVPEWAFPVMPMIDPEKEGLAYKRMVRSGQMTPSEMLLETGRDPTTHWQSYADDFAVLDRLKIVIDSDARKVTDQGQAQLEPTAVDTSKPKTAPSK